MKRRVSEGFLAAFLALGLVLGCLGCFLSVYDLPAGRNVLAVSVLSCVLLGVMLMPLRRGSEAALCAAALVLGYLLHRPETLGALKSLLNLVSVQLDGAWHWGYFAFPGHTPGNVEIPLCLYGGFLGLTVCRSVLRRRGSVLPLVLAAPGVVLSAMIPGKNPAGWAVFAFLTSAAMLLLTAQARKNSALQGIKLARAAVLPVLLCVGLLLLCNPQEGYVDRAAPARERILGTLREVSIRLSSASFVPQVARRTDLAALDGGEPPKVSVLSVTAPESGALYLRGQDFDTYTGTEWTSDPGRVEPFDGWGEARGTVSVETYGVRDLIFLPYYPGAGTVLTGGALANTDGVTAYTFPRYPQGSAMGEETLEIFLTLPDTTRRWAEAMLPDNPGAAEIGALVRNSGVYDLNTPRMPEGERDFVRWFLEEAHRGYCVHFASAATVLLRSAGIPARYVTGYLQEVRAGEKTVVTTRQAHAWAEYYDAAEGAWRILEATPAALVSDGQTDAPTGLPAAPEPGLAGGQKPDSRMIGRGYLVWLLLPGAALMLILRRCLLRMVWEYRKKRGTARRRVLLLWQEAEVLSKACGREIPEELLELAQKARFSQHRITAMDAVPLETFCQDCRERLQKAPWWKRLWLFVSM